MATKIHPIRDYSRERGETLPPPPRPLGEHGLSLWNQVQRAYKVEDVGGCQLLYQLCDAVDLAETLADVIRTEGPMLQTKSTRRTHPAVRELVQVKALIARLIEQLGINSEAAKPALGRPPRGFGWMPDAT